MSLLNIRERGVIVGQLDTATATLVNVTNPRLTELFERLVLTGVPSMFPTVHDDTKIGYGIEMRKVGPETVGLLIPQLNRNGFLCDREA